MYLVCGDLVFVWFYRSLPPADGFFFQYCDHCDLTCFALVLVREVRLEWPREWLGGLRVRRGWLPRRRQHLHQSSRQLESAAFPWKS